ncbi:MazG family protein [Microcella sp.]|uniref:MazG family protein n=1 Tax=Microcella sp. TaxID=1913979 RepID=UPI00391D8A44
MATPEPRSELPLEPTPELTPQPHPELDRLIAVMAHLRAPGGCAWDAEQTHQSLAKYLIEESHELVEAIEHGTRDDILEELGDVLYQVLFHADIAAADPHAPFTIEDVARVSAEKMIGRHPHVFGDVRADTAEEVSANWERWKRKEKPTRASSLDGLPAALPTLVRAEKVLGRAERIGIALTDGAAMGAEAGGNPSTAGRITPAAGAVDDETALHDEAALGQRLLALVADSRARGLDVDRALRGAVRELEHRIRASESESDAAHPE